MDSDADTRMMLDMDFAYIFFIAVLRVVRISSSRLAASTVYWGVAVGAGFHFVWTNSFSKWSCPAQSWVMIRNWVTVCWVRAASQHSWSCSCSWRWWWRNCYSCSPVWFNRITIYIDLCHSAFSCSSNSSGNSLGLRLMITTTNRPPGCDRSPLLLYSIS